MTTFTPTFERTIGFDRVTKDYAAYCDGQVIGFFPSYLEAENALNEHIANLIRDTAIVTADIEAERAEIAPVFVSSLYDAALAIQACDEAELERARLDVALQNLRSHSCANSLQSDPPSPDPTPPPWEDCRNCGGAHSIQTCPELWSALRAPVATPTADAFFILPSDLCTDTMRLSIDGHVHTITAALIAGALGLTSPAAPNVDALLNEADQILASIDYTTTYLQQFNVAYCLSAGIITEQQLAERRAA